MKKLRFSTLQIFIGLGGIFLVIIGYMFNNYANNYLIKVNKTNNIILNLEKEEYNLNYNILKNSFFLYSSFDDTAQSIKRIQKKLKILKEYLKKLEPFTLKYYENYKESIEKKISYVFDFQRLNAPLKTSTIYLLTILPKIYKNNFPNEYKRRAIDIITSIYLAKFTYDLNLIKNIDLSYFKRIKFKNTQLEAINKSFLLNVDFIKNNLTKYSIYLNKSLQLSSLEKLKILEKKFLTITDNTIRSFKIIGYVGIIILTSVIFILIILIDLIEKDKEIFKKLAYMDNITNLYNMNKFAQDENKFNAILFLNIEGFRNINELYGREIGDELLKEVGRHIKKLNPNSYRLSADNFAILLNSKEEAKKYFSIITEEFDKFFYYVDKNIEFQINFKASISDTKPLLKTAEIAIHFIKKNKRVKCIEYTQKLDNSEQIKENIKKTNILTSALKNDKVIPYFQPILNLKNGKIEKYEVLARIENEGQIEPIFPYLEIAKENRLYKEITKSIIRKSFEKLYDKKVNFSINLSIEDMLDVEIILFLKKKLREYKGIEKHLTLEILESEAVKDYHQIEKFIKLMKKKSISFAIDDFGSGYSNFAHLINLDIDYIKIDGSLIRNIDKDEISKNVVELIADFSKKHNIKIIAEFVHNEKILEIVKKIGIDYAQGFYISKPMPDILTDV